MEPSFPVRVRLPCLASERSVSSLAAAVDRICRGLPQFRLIRVGRWCSQRAFTGLDDKPGIALDKNVSVGLVKKTLGLLLGYQGGHPVMDLSHVLVGAGRDD